MEIKCTQCGGAVPIATDQGVAQCGFCGSSLYVSLRDGYVHNILKPLVPEKDIQKVLQTYLERKERRGVLKIKKASMVFWPYWQINENGKMTSCIAAANPITSLENADIPPGDPRPFNQDETGSIWVEPPSVALEDMALRDAVNLRDVRLLHVPFWIVDYEYDEVTYEVWMDAVRGNVYADELPPTFAKEKDRQYAIAAAMMFAVFLVAGIIAPTGNRSIIYYLIASVPIYYGIKRMLKGVMS